MYEDEATGQELTEVVGRGVLAGSMATVAMSAIIAGGWFGGLLRTPPPKQITASLTRPTLGRSDDSPGFHLTWIVMHVLYGAGCGVLFVWLRDRIRALPRIPTGIVFGVGVWAVSYFGLMPGLRLYPSPRRDNPGRVLTMILAHVVFGLSLAAVDRRLSSE